MERAINEVAAALLDPQQDEKAQTVPLVFPKPLEADTSLMIELITERYEGAGAAQFMKCETEEAVTLHIPKAIRPTFMNRAAS